jgi:hypothetical protein
MEELFERISQKCTEGIPYNEAVQFTLWVYCTLDVLPSEFRAIPLSRAELSALLSRLGAAGKIRLQSEQAAEAADILDADLSQPEHWENLLSKFLRSELTLDETFPMRISRYV